MAMCTHCGGLIMKPNVPYGWAGDVCHCPKPGETQKDGESYKEFQKWLKQLEEKKNGSE